MRNIAKFSTPCRVCADARPVRVTCPMFVASLKGIAIYNMSEKKKKKEKEKRKKERKRKRKLIRKKIKKK